MPITEMLQLLCWDCWWARVWPLCLVTVSGVRELPPTPTRESSRWYGPEVHFKDKPFRAATAVLPQPSDTQVTLRTCPF